MTQALAHQNALRTESAQHFLKSKELRDAGPEAIRCLVVAGRALTDENQHASFEVFRNASEDVDVLTDDELLEKLKYIRDQLSPPLQPDALVQHDFPF